jgi:hypothetical protein
VGQGCSSVVEHLPITGEALGSMGERGGKGCQLSLKSELFGQVNSEMTTNSILSISST